MEALWWTITLALMFVGLIGAVFPVVPDSLSILAGAFLHHFMVRADHTVGWGTLGVLTFLCVLAHVVDFTAGSFGASRFGASKWGVLGGFAGGIVGLFFFPVGLFLGPVLGALCAEVVFAGRTLGPATKSGWGALVGLTMGMIGKVIIDVSMVGIFLWRALAH